ncbi:hypothetical protein ACFL0E_00945 [Nanoarchaeota archaeon]
MEKTIRSALGAAAGIFITISLFSTLMAVPEFNQIISKMVTGIVTGLVIGGFVAAIIGIALLYISIKGK